MNDKLLSRGFVVGKHFSKEEDDKMLSTTRCYRCQQLGHISRNRPNAPVTEKPKTTSVGFSHDFFFTDAAKDGTAATFMILEEPEIPSSVGGVAVSAPDFTLGDDSDSELEIVDAAAPLNQIPARAPDGTTESLDMVEYKDASSYVSKEHALDQLKFSEGP